MKSSEKSAYYNHDEDWKQRADQGNPMWGGQSEKVYERFLALLRPHLLPGASVMDCGCGAGAFGLRVQNEGYIYCGADESAVAINLGRDTFAKKGISIDLRQIDLALGVSGNKCNDLTCRFDAATSINVLHCLIEGEHRKNYLAFVFDILRPSGHFFLSTMCGPPAPGYRPSRRPRIYSHPDEIMQEIRAAGFLPPSLVEIEPVHERSLVPNLLLVCSKPG